MFYTPDTITVSEGQKITGRLSCAPNGRNPRDLDIAITYEAEGEPAKEIQYKMCVIPSFSSCRLRAVPWAYADRLSGRD